jgi:RNase P protein component
VLRNRLRRRTRAIARVLIDTSQLTGDVVVRFRCDGDTPTFAELNYQIRSAVRRWADE